MKSRVYEAREISSRLLKLGLPLLNNQDPLRLVLHTAFEGISGLDADEWFISKGIYAELPEPGCLTFCLGLASQKGLVTLLKRRWDQLLSADNSNRALLPFSRPPIPFLDFPEMNFGVAWRLPWESIDLQEAVGRISADLICPYPPGIPYVFPGEKLDQERVNWLMEQYQLWSGQVSNQIRVVLK